jgi:hypothetical protein
MITRFQIVLGARDWDGMAKIFAEDICLDDRRRVVGASFVGREATIANMQASADTGVKNVTSTVLAIRGDRLSLQRVVISGRDNRPDAFRTEALGITEVDVHDKAIAFVMFDPDELDAAFAELDARYLAGEAASHSGTWSAIAEGYAAFNRREMPKTTPNWLNIDHRRGGSAFAPGDQTSYIHATWEVAPQVRSDAAAVHRLNKLGAVVTQTTSGTSHEGFDVEWQDIILFTVDGDFLARCEVFNEDDLDAALAKFDELSRQAPRLQNLASQVGARFRAAYASREWDAMADMLADDSYNDDRRSVVNGGIRRGRDSMMDDLRSGADIGIPEFRVTEIATRGERLVLVRAESHYDERPEAFYVENLTIGEIDADQRIAAQVMFDLDDIDAAYHELESRYLLGEAAAHAQTWSAIVDTYAGLNRHELASTPPDWVYVDHHRLALWQGDFTANMLAAWEVMPDWRIRIETVHRLTHLGAVITAVASGSSREGFDAEEPGIALVTVREGAINRFEYFDVTDLDAALAKFDELNRQAARPENMATRLHARLNAAFAARDWNAMAQLVTHDTSSDDRRPIVGGGLRSGRDNVIDDWRAIAGVGVKNITSTVIATRGEHLALGRYGFVGHDQRPEAYHTEVLGIVECDGDHRMTACVMLDIDEIKAAFDELEARYVAGEAARHAHTWTLVTNAFAAMNRREMPETRPDWVTTDRRRLSMIDPTSRDQYLSAAIDVTQLGVYVEEVHRLTDAGAVVSWQSRWTTPEGFDAEWRGISVLTFDGDLVARCELFDDADLEVALERFDELTPDVPRLANAASNAYKRYNAHFVAREWDAMAEIVADDVLTDDRRRVVSGGIQSGRAAQAADMRAVAGVGVKSIESSVIATRGDRLALIRARVAGDERPDAFGIELLIVVGIDEDGRLVAGILFDLDDIDAASAELEARYVAGEAAAHSQTWSVIARTYVALNRHEIPETIADTMHVDHRQIITIEPSEMGETISAAWELLPDLRMYVEAVHLLTGFGAVVTSKSYGTSQDGFAAEWRMLHVLRIDGDRISRLELFDESDLDAALARLDELGQSAPRLENAATRASAALADAFNRRDPDSLVAVYGENAEYEDRRKGLRNVGLLSRDFGNGLFELAAASSWRMDAAPIGIRGKHLALVQHTYRDTAVADQPVTVEALLLTETDASGLTCHCILFDADDIDAAFQELDARYGAGEGAAHAHTWALVTHSYATFSRHEMPATTPDWTNIDHRRAAAFGPGDLAQYVRAAWSVTPDTKAHIQAVHRLNGRGAVLTVSTYGTSPQGFEAEWQDIHLATFDGDLCDRFELFDEADLDAALGRFDELSVSARQLENAATRANSRVVDAYNRRDVDGLLAAWESDGRYDDRRKGLQDDGQFNRDYARELMRDAPTSWRMETDVVGIRGRHLALVRQTWRDTSEADRAVAVELLAVLAATHDELTYYAVFFDSDDIEAAHRELTARWIASGECVNPEIIEAVRILSDSANRHEWDALAARHSGATYTNHRQLRSGADTVAEDMSSLRMLSSLVPDLRFETAEFLALSATGVVIHTVAKGTSTDDVPIEIPFVILVMIDGDRITHAETFDLYQRDQAISRFDELSAAAPLREKVVARVLARVVDAFDRRDPDRYLALFAKDCVYEDRRKGLRDAGSISTGYAQTVTFGAAVGWQAEFETIAVRGEHLMLGRATFRDQSEAGSPIAVEALNVGSLNDDELISWFAVFDPDDIDAAFAELTARWIASGEVAHPEVIEAAHRSNEMYNRHDWDAIKANESGATYVNHRQLVSAEPETIEDHWRSIRALASLIPDLRTEPTEILSHSAKGLVADLVVKGRTPEGAVIEFPAITLILFDGTRVTHMEAFDVNQRAQALARFDELNLST